jgi:glycosyltransferase involved in cell wall biosynthesis
MIRFVNQSKNTVYLGDIDKPIPFCENDIQELDEFDARKSLCFQKMIETGEFKVIPSDMPNLFERTLIRRFNNYAKNKQSEEIIEELPLQFSKQMQVCIKGHFYNMGGYAKVNRNLVFGLKELGVDAIVDPISEARIEMKDSGIKFISKLKRKPNRNAIRIDSMIPTMGSTSMGSYKIIYTTVESTTVPKQFLEVLNSYNEIWATSDFCKEVLERETGRKVFVLPDSIDAEHYTPEGETYEFQPALRGFVFLFVGSWNYRKGYDALLRAFLGEFNGDEDVTLLLVGKHFYNPNRNKDIKTEVAQFIQKYGGKNPPHIARYSAMIPESIMPHLYRACHAYVILTRGEGFNVPVCEASLCGLPVITTDHSGHTMFLDNENSTLVPIDRLRKIEPGMMNVHYWDGQYFADLTSKSFIKSAGRAMRDVYENYDVAKDKNKVLQDLLHREYSIPAVAAKAKNKIEDIWRKNNGFVS